MSTNEEVKFDLFCDKLFKYGTYIMAGIICACLISSAVVNILKAVEMIR